MNSFTLSMLQMLFVPKFRMEAFGVSLGASRDKSKFKEETTSTVDKTSTKQKDLTGLVTADQKQTTAATDVTKSTQSGEELLSLLDEETQGLLTGLLSDLAAGSEQTGEVASALNTRALNAEDDLAGLVDPIVANARGNLEDQLGQSVQGLARAAGSSQNSLVQQLGLKEAANVEREIASLAATLGLQTHQAATETQTAALGASGNAVAELANVLKGSTQKGTSSQSSDVVRQLEELLSGSTTEKTEISEVERLTEIINALQKSKGRGTSNNLSASGSFATAG